MTYAYGQIPLHELTKNVYFSNSRREIHGDVPVHYGLLGYYELTITATEFQKMMDITLANIISVFGYIDDILLVTQGKKQEHVNKVREIMKIFL